MDRLLRSSEHGRSATGESNAVLSGPCSIGGDDQAPKFRPAGALGGRSYDAAQAKSEKSACVLRVNVRWSLVDPAGPVMINVVRI